MVDILDMEDIFVGHIMSMFTLEMKIGYPFANTLAKKLIKEVKDFVDDQKNIACNNCKGKKFKKMKEPWQAM